ncbi:MAG: hypothetical protein ACYC55_05460 [Candidatus Geothermincolia bacterium]
MSAVWLAVFLMAPLSLGSLLLLLLLLSRRLGQALGVKRFYLLYWPAAFLVVAGPLAGGILELALPQAGSATLAAIKAFVFLSPAAIGLTVGVYATGRYWSWIWEELRAEGDGHGWGRV